MCLFLETLETITRKKFKKITVNYASPTNLINTHWGFLKISYTSLEFRWMIFWQNCNEALQAKTKSFKWCIIHQMVYHTSIDTILKSLIGKGSGSFLHLTSLEKWKFFQNLFCCLLCKKKTQVEDFEFFFDHKASFHDLQKVLQKY